MKLILQNEKPPHNFTGKMKPSDLKDGCALVYPVSQGSIHGLKFCRGKIQPSLSKEQGSELNTHRLCENILIYLFFLARPDYQSGWAYWPASQHMLSWELGTTQTDSSPERKGVQKELEMISED